MIHSKTTLLKDESAWRARALVDLAALNHNIDQIRSVAPDSKIMAVIKADAYGHGLNEITGAIYSKIDAFAVATIDEGIQCRSIQNEKSVIVLSEFWQPNQLMLFEQYAMDLVVHNLEQVSWLQYYQGQPLSVWVKVDSGMNRLGIDLEQVDEIYDVLKNLKCVNNLRLMSHLANADVAGDKYTEKQLCRFKQATATFDCEKSFANSAGIMQWPLTHFDWVRPGLMLYGANPCEQAKNSDIPIPLSPVMTLQARLIAIKNVAADQPVGYGGVYRTSRKSIIAMVGLGYGDGYPRVVAPEAYVVILGQRASIVGRISMDMITVDVTDIDSVAVGDIVTLWGHELNIEEVASWTETIPYELLCKVTTRIPRYFIGSD